MAHNFGALVFTPAVQALQEKYGSRRSYAHLTAGATRDVLGPDEEQFLGERDSFYMASNSASGWPYVQHRGGPAGFLHVIDQSTIAFADYRGNKQYISTGNFATDNRVAIILVDYPNQTRLKILGRVEVLEGATAGEWTKRLAPPRGYPAVVERVFLIRVEAFDWNCQQHIVPRFTAEQIQHVVEPMEERLKELEAENAKLRADH
jgi:predicted pyridoxine 5'-phosphate oxidase superfamily flavin-nucleotide-binding protein